MTRLTSQIREQILDNLLANTYGKCQIALADTGSLLADKIYENKFSKGIRDIMVSLPYDFFRRDTYVNVSICGEYTRLGMSEERPFPYERSTEVILQSHPLYAEASTYIKGVRDLNKEIRESRAQARSVLDSKTTIASLLKLWPEVKPFLPEGALTPNQTVAVGFPIDQINKTFGLPVKE